ncbi:MAG: bacteriorhodopsin [Phycisphaerae bacterium]
MPIVYQSFENYIEYSPWVYQVTGHVLTLGAACMVAGFVYFLVTASQVSPRYRSTNYLSAVVMASAALELGLQAFFWEVSFTRNAMTGMFQLADGQLFSNGYRYANWSIDVPVLLTQMLVVLGLTGAAFWRNYWQFVVAGLLMIWTGYIGQYFEAVPTADGLVQTSGFWIWFVISWIFYIWLLVVLFKVTWKYVDTMPANCQQLTKGVAVFLLVTWTLYPFAYLCPWFAFNEGSVLARQVLYTVADVTSKVIYGVLLGRVAVLRSAAEGYIPAMDAQLFEHDYSAQFGARRTVAGDAVATNRG